VAIYHFSAKVIGRSGGRSAIASAAYRAGERLHDEKLDRDHDYTEKAGVVHREIMLPDGAPQRWADRGTLWNEVEAAEKRKDAQLARDIEISLPRELGKAEAIRLAQDFVREQFVDRGMVADLNVHWTQARDGGEQPHAHVMLTMREVVPGREGHEEEGVFGKKVVAWNDRALLGEWRKRWAELANARLLELGHDIRIDHRSYAEQGIDLEPQHKIGPAGVRREDREQDAERAAEHREIARRNGDKLSEEPEIALRALTHQHSTFTRQELARFVDRHTDGAEQFGIVMAKVEAAAPELVRLGQDGRGRDRFTTREMLDTEARMERAADGIAGRDEHRVLQAAGWRAERAAERDGLLLGEEQRAAFRHVTSGPDLTLVVGYAGSGKSAMLGVARRAWEAEGFTVRGAALSGIAAEGLEGGSGIASRTIASLEYAWKEGRDQLTSRDVLVVDEAGMIGSRQMQRVLSAAQAAGAKVVLVGDPEQLQAIEAGAAFRALAERHGAAEITTIRRQDEGWQREATRELATGRTAQALERYRTAGMVHAAGTREAARKELVAGWDTARQERPEESRVILAYTRDDVRALNELARGRMREAGSLHRADQVVQTERGERAFAAGDRIMFQRNERGLGGDGRGRDGVAVKNGTLGTVLAVEAGGERLTVRLDGPGGSGSAKPADKDGREVTFSTRDYAHIDHGYAATVHKAQGVTVDRAHVLATPHMDRHAAYVGLTRHRDGVALHYGRDDFAEPARLVRALGRERSKDTTLDYDRDGEDLVRRYAERRGLDPLRPESEIVVWPPLEPELAAPQRSRFAGLGFGAEPGERQVPPAEPVKAVPAPEPAPGLAETVATGRAGFRERFEAHRQQQAQARDETAARDLVGQWDWLLTAYNAALPKLAADPALGGTREQLAQFGRGVREQPGVVRVLREQGEAFGMAERPNLARIVADREPERVVAGIMAKAEDGMREQLRAAAELEAARQRELRAQQAPRLSRGPSMGM
jgi:Ti-type conjugative transfer relaxase TraA